jgi:hypothetical protein
LGVVKVHKSEACLQDKEENSDNNKVGGWDEPDILEMRNLLTALRQEERMLKE